MEPPTNEQKRYERPVLDSDAEMLQKLWAEKQWKKKQEKRDDSLRADKKHRLWYRNEMETKDWHANHPDNQDIDDVDVKRDSKM